LEARSNKVQLISKRTQLAIVTLTLLVAGCVGSPGEIPQNAPTADLVLLDRNIVALYGNGQIADIVNTQVHMTLFDDEVIHRRTN
jgi:hypothetical protein